MTGELRLTAIEIDGTVTRSICFAQSFGEDLFAALREAMLKRGCLRDRQHKGQCLNCALLPQCAVWPAVAPADPTRRQRGPYLRPFVLRIPSADPAGLPLGARVTYGATIVHDPTFPILASAHAAAFVAAARQVAEWGFGPALREGERAARKGAISVGRVRWVNPVTGETEPLLPTGDDPPRAPLVATFAESTPGAISESLTLTFLTPTRLVAAGTSLTSPAADVLMRRIAERLDAVATAAGVTPPGLLDQEGFVAAIARLRLSDDTTTWIGDPKRGGFVGSVRLAAEPDDLAIIVPLLHWGGALGVGKGTLHGAGRFVIGPVPATARVDTAAAAPERAGREKPPSMQPGQRPRIERRPAAVSSPRRRRD